MPIYTHISLTTVTTLFLVKENLCLCNQQKRNRKVTLYWLGVVRKASVSRRAIAEFNCMRRSVTEEQGELDEVGEIQHIDH